MCDGMCSACGDDSAMLRVDARRGQRERRPAAGSRSCGSGSARRPGGRGAAAARGSGSRPPFAGSRRSCRRAARCRAGRAHRRSPPRGRPDSAALSALHRLLVRDGAGAMVDGVRVAEEGADGGDVGLLAVASRPRRAAASATAARPRCELGRRRRRPRSGGRCSSPRPSAPSRSAGSRCGHARAKAFSASVVPEGVQERHGARERRLGGGRAGGRERDRPELLRAERAGGPCGPSSPRAAAGAARARARGRRRKRTADSCLPPGRRFSSGASSRSRPALPARQRPFPEAGLLLLAPLGRARSA